jgi:hypothetical protein
MSALCIDTLLKYTSVSKPEFRGLSLGVLREIVEYIKIYKYRKIFPTNSRNIAGVSSCSWQQWREFHALTSSFLCFVLC